MRQEKILACHCFFSALAARLACLCRRCLLRLAWEAHYTLTTCQRQTSHASVLTMEACLVKTTGLSRDECKTRQVQRMFAAVGQVLRSKGLNFSSDEGEKRFHCA